MKAKIIIPLLALLVFSSCIVKSLHPFYTKEKIVSNKKLEGTWEDSKKGNWEFLSFKTQWEHDRKAGEKISEADKDEYGGSDR